MFRNFALKLHQKKNICTRIILNTLPFNIRKISSLTVELFFGGWKNPYSTPKIANSKDISKTKHKSFTTVVNHSTRIFIACEVYRSKNYIRVLYEKNKQNKKKKRIPNKYNRKLCEKHSSCKQSIGSKTVCIYENCIIIYYPSVGVHIYCTI